MAECLTDSGFVTDQAVLLDGERITAIVPPNDARCRAASQYDLKGLMLLPGFIDTQVNGGGGVLFNAEPDVATIRTIGQAHRRFGTTGFLPTLISDDLNVVARAVAPCRRRWPAACRECWESISKARFST